MKQLLTTLCILFSCTASYSQKLNDFFYYEGVRDLASMAHPFDTFQAKYSTYNDGDPENIIVSIFYEGDYFTKIKIHKGFGDYYFDQMEVLEDNNTSTAFFAFKTFATLLIQLQRKTDPNSYEEMQQNFETLFGTRLENWTGIEMALFAINIAYLDDYASKN